MVQKMAVVLAALSIVLDGFDSQLIGFAIPVMIKEWGVTRGEFAPALAAGLFGMGLGSVLAGYFADRFGRRMALIGSVFLLVVHRLYRPAGYETFLRPPAPDIVVECRQRGRFLLGAQEPVF
jgi:MFS family permease